MSDRVRPEPAQLGRRAREARSPAAAVVLEENRRRRPGEPERDAALREGGLLADSGHEVAEGAPEALGDAARKRFDLGGELVVERERTSGGSRQELDGAVVVSGPETARHHAEIRPEPVRERRRELLGPVAHDDDAVGLEPEACELLREERAVQVATVAADELASGDDDDGPREEPTTRSRRLARPSGLTTAIAGPSGMLRIRSPFTVPCR